jgi:hypothetical protein
MLPCLYPFPRLPGLSVSTVGWIPRIALEAEQVLIARMQRGAGNEIQGTIPGASSHVLY